MESGVCAHPARRNQEACKHCFSFSFLWMRGEKGGHLTVCAIRKPLSEALSQVTRTHPLLRTTCEHGRGPPHKPARSDTEESLNQFIDRRHQSLVLVSTIESRGSSLTSLLNDGSFFTVLIRTVDRRKKAGLDKARGRAEQHTSWAPTKRTSNCVHNTAKFCFRN